MNVFVGGSGTEFLGLSEVFIILFVTFGPINFISRFGRMTVGLDRKALAGLAVRSTLLATAAIALSAFVGEIMLQKWKVSLPALALTGAIVLFAAAMRSIVALYRTSAAPTNAAETSPKVAAAQLVFPYIATPYGIAATIVLLTLAPANARDIFLTLLVVMLVDFVMMLFVRPIMKVLSVPLGLLGTLLSVLQVALSVQFAFFAIRTLLEKGL